MKLYPRLPCERVKYKAMVAQIGAQADEALNKSPRYLFGNLTGPPVSCWIFGRISGVIWQDINIFFRPDCISSTKVSYIYAQVDIRH